ncbi:hypothetical protein EK904_000443 [Melospiza melodia maxima]|nr:hypothetical protein EK904_000443 [Melospiza melodia maxima]
MEGCRVLVDARDKLGIPWQYTENEKHGMFLMAFENKAGMPIEPATFQLYVPALAALWRDSGIKEAFSRRSEYQLPFLKQTNQFCFLFPNISLSLFPYPSQSPPTQVPLFLVWEPSLYCENLGMLDVIVGKDGTNGTKIIFLSRAEQMDTNYEAVDAQHMHSCLQGVQLPIHVAGLLPSLQFSRISADVSCKQSKFLVCILT